MTLRFDDVTEEKLIVLTPNMAALSRGCKPRTIVHRRAVQGRTILSNRKEHIFGPTGGNDRIGQREPK